MPPYLFRLVLLISCAHALVHVYELAFSSVEQLVATEFQVGTAETGALARDFRLPFGVLALAAGFLADWLGAKRMLVAYLLGCGLTCLAIWQTESLSSLGGMLFVLGMFASIYHPAGLSLISQHTTPENRPRALGVHGIFGSLGIGGAPFLAGSLLPLLGDSWREYYALLAVPGVLLAIWFMFRLDESSDAGVKRNERDTGPAITVPASTPHREDQADWPAFGLLTIFGALSGFIYAPFVTFLPRYIHDAQLRIGSLPPSATWNYISGLVLLLGMIGQYVAGRIARPKHLEWLMAGILLANAPLLAWMAVAEGAQRAWAASLFALVHFMNQPVYNSLIASYSLRRLRSICYGFSFMMSFGIGSLGPWLIGRIERVEVAYFVLAGVAVAAGVVGICLALIRRGRI